MFQSGAQFMILAALVGLLLMREARLDAPVRGIDESFADFLAINAQRTEEPAPVTLVGIGENSEHPWPWSPLDFALFFQTAEEFAPACSATDEVLRWDASKAAPALAEKLPQYQKILREQILRASKVLLGAQLGYPDDPTALPPLQETPLIRNVTGNLSNVPEFTAIEAQADDDFRLSSITGFTNLPRAGRFTRSAPLILRYRGNVVPGFTLQAILTWEKLTADDVSVEVGAHVKVGDRVTIPIDDEGRMRIDFGVPRRRCSAGDLALASAQAEGGHATIVPRDWLAEKFLLLARTDPPSKTVLSAPGSRMSPGEFFAAAIATIQKGSFIKRAPVGFDLTMIVILALVARASTRWDKVSTVFAIVLASVIYVMAAIVIFGRTLVWLPAVMPGGLALFIVLFRLATPRREPRWSLEKIRK
jgi:hypothetical protein